MNGESTHARWWRTGLIVAGATALAIALPTAAMPLYLAAYPDLDVDTFAEALIPADIDAGFGAAEVTQFETLPFHATLIYDAPVDDPELFTIQVAQSNAAALTAESPDAFAITPTSPSVMFLNAGTARPEGGFALTWTWDVTPLIAGEQKLNVQIIPQAFVNGVRQELSDVNAPVAVTVQVHPAQVDFEEVVSSVAAMETDVPDDMTVGREHDVSATLSMAGNGDTVSADIGLTAAEDSVRVTILPAEAVARAAAGTADDDVVERHWTVIPEEAGPVSLVFTVHVGGTAGSQELSRDVPRTIAARAEDPPEPVWEVIRGPVTVLGAIIAVITGAIGLWAMLRNRSNKKAAADEHDEGDDAVEDDAADVRPAGRARDGES